MDVKFIEYRVGYPSKGEMWQYFGLGILCAILGLFTLIMCSFGPPPIASLPNSGVAGGIVGSSLLFVGSIAQFFRGAPLARHRWLIASNPDSPWYRDYAWNPANAKNLVFWRRSTREPNFIYVFLISWLFMGCVMAWDMGYKSVVKIVALELFITLGVFIWKLFQTSPRSPFGAKLQFVSFPFIIGKKVMTRFSASPLLAKGTMTANLRRTEIVDGAYAMNQPIAFEQSKPVDLMPLQLGVPVSIEFDLPAEQRATKFENSFQSYWFLYLTAVHRGQNYSFAYLMPIYNVA